MTRELDPDRRLALTYVPTAIRPAIEALWQLDLALGTVLVTGREPMISQIRLAWWRETLEKLDGGAPPEEPVLKSLARHVLPGGVSGAELAGMEEGWTLLLSPDVLTSAELQTYAGARGGLLFALSARLLGGPEEVAIGGGEAWALIDLARNSGNEADAAAALQQARAARGPDKWPSRLRPLGMLAALARRDAQAGPPWEQPGAPGRMLRMLRHRMTGR